MPTLNDTLSASKPGFWRSLSLRARWTRTGSSDMLLNDPDGWMSDGEHGPVWWLGMDSGGGAHPIGPNGPWRTTAAALPAVTRATSLIVDPIAQSPLKTQELGFAGSPLPTPRWLTDPMLLRPDARYAINLYPSVVKLPRSKFWGDLIRSALWWGTGAFICQQDSFGSPNAGTLRLLHPASLSTQRDDNGGLRWRIGSDVVADRDGYFQTSNVDALTDDVDSVPANKRYRIVVLRNPASPVDADGYSMGVFEMSPSAFALSSQLDTYASGTFRSGIPAGYLKVETPGLTQEQADALKTRWMENHGGDRRSIAVLNATTEFHPLNLSPVDAELAAVKRLNVADVAFAFGIDPAMLGASLNNSSTYSNVRDYFRQHRDLGIGIWIAAFQDVLTALLPGTQGVRVDLDALTQAEPAERYAAYETAIRAGVLTVNEVRAAEGLPPLDEPDAERFPAPQLVPDPTQNAESEGAA